MQKTYRVRITQIGASKAIRLPKELASSLSTTEVILEQTVDGILMKPAPVISPLSQWTAIFARADTGANPEFNDWNITLHDGLEEG